jgi:hypothetical protein
MTTKKGNTSTKDEAELEIRSSLRLDYRLTYYVDGVHQDSPPDPADAKFEQAHLALVHLEALFQLLALVDSQEMQREAREHPDDFAIMWEHLGQLGGKIAVAAYSNMDEGRRLAAKASS